MLAWVWLGCGPADPVRVGSTDAPVPSGEAGRIERPCDPRRSVNVSVVVATAEIRVQRFPNGVEELQRVPFRDVAAVRLSRSAGCVVVWADRVGAEPVLLHDAPVGGPEPGDVGGLEARARWLAKTLRVPLIDS